LEIPNSNPIGGDAGGMDGMDAPAPPMDADPMMGDQSMGGPEMTDEPIPGDQGDVDAPDQPEGSEEDSELNDVLDKMSIEDKAAVLKYAKSIVDDSGQEEGDDSMQVPDDNMMPEARRSFMDIIDETINSFMDDEDEETTDRPDKRMPRKYRNGGNPEISDPFKSQY
jgi:hypothetical protein